MLNEREMRAVGAALKTLAVYEREDVVGVFMKQGAFRYLTSAEIVTLSKKLEAAVPPPEPEDAPTDPGPEDEPVDS